MRRVVEALLVVASFVEIMQATKATDMFLNIEAIRFVGKFDNLAFSWLRKVIFLKGFNKTQRNAKQFV